MDKKQSIEELQGELENLLDVVTELDRIMRDEEDDMFKYIAASAHKEMFDKRIKEIREYLNEDKVRNIYEVCLKRISKTVGFPNFWTSIKLIDGIIFMDNIYNYVCSQVCSICKTNSDIDIYKSVSRHGLYPNKHNDLIIEYLYIQDQLEQHMLGFISSAFLPGKMREAIYFGIDLAIKDLEEGRKVGQNEKI